METSWRYMHLEPKWGPCFDWSLSLILGGWLSKNRGELGFQGIGYIWYPPPLNKNTAIYWSFVNPNVAKLDSQDLMKRLDCLSVWNIFSVVKKQPFSLPKRVLQKTSAFWEDTPSLRHIFELYNQKLCCVDLLIQWHTMTGPEKLQDV